MIFAILKFRNVGRSTFRHSKFWPPPNFTQRYGKDRQRCQKNKFYYAVWQLLLYYYREFPSKIAQGCIVTWKFATRSIELCEKKYFNINKILVIKKIIVWTNSPSPMSWQFNIHGHIVNRHYFQNNLIKILSSDSQLDISKSPMLSSKVHPNQQTSHFVLDLLFSTSESWVQIRNQCVICWILVINFEFLNFE